MTARRILISGLVLMLLAVMLGAFGAHALKAMLDASQLQIWKTASTYHFYHALGLIGLGIWAERRPAQRLAGWSGWLLTLGVVVFSGSLYLLAVSGLRWLGMITPIGGILFLVGWLCWILAALKQNRQRD